MRFGCGVDAPAAPLVGRRDAGPPRPIPSDPRVRYGLRPGLVRRGDLVPGPRRFAHACDPRSRTGRPNPLGGPPLVDGPPGAAQGGLGCRSRDLPSAPIRPLHALQWDPWPRSDRDPTLLPVPPGTCTLPPVEVRVLWPRLLGGQSHGEAPGGSRPLVRGRPRMT